MLEEKESNVGHLESVRFHIEKENVEITQKKHRFDWKTKSTEPRRKKRGEKIEKLEKVNFDQHMKIKNLKQLNSDQNKGKVINKWEEWSIEPALHQ